MIKINRDSVRFFVRLCSDVFLEVLGWGDRSQLAFLETLGRRFFWSIDGHFGEKPFLRKDLLIMPRYILSLIGPI